jgi:hypothetical protein
MDTVTSQRIGKVLQAINSLPNNPRKHIYWIVYNHDMIKYTEDMIAEIKGKEYLSNHVTVVAKTDPSKDRTKGSVYFDPGLLDLLGNGNA